MIFAAILVVSQSRSQKGSKSTHSAVTKSPRKRANSTSYHSVASTNVTDKRHV